MNLLRGLKVMLMIRNPKMMLRGRNVTITGFASLNWGHFLNLGDNVHIDAFSLEGISIGEKVSIGAYSRVIASGSIMNPGKGIKIGNNVGMGEFAYLGGGGGLEIGNDCIAGQYLSCHPENHVTEDVNTPIRLQGVTRKGIKIGNNCWIGSKVTILDGATVGNNCVIAAGAVVNKSFPDNCVIGGVPAKILRQNTNKSNLLPFINDLSIAAHL
jgi:acetyltransferase-like isoleucine patch superfamily enzyme